MVQTFRRYDELIAALRARRIELGLTMLELDARIGWPDGYTSKIEAGFKTPGVKTKRGNFRALGPATLHEVLRGLDLELTIAPAGEAMLAIRTHGPDDVQIQHWTQRLSPEERVMKMRDVAFQRWFRESCSQRSRHAREMSLSRWREAREKMTPRERRRAKLRALAERKRRARKKALNQG